MTLAGCVTLDCHCASTLSHHITVAGVGQASEQQWMTVWDGHIAPDLYLYDGDNTYQSM